MWSGSARLFLFLFFFFWSLILDRSKICVFVLVLFFSPRALPRVFCEIAMLDVNIATVGRPARKLFALVVLTRTMLLAGGGGDKHSEKIPGIQAGGYGGGGRAEGYLDDGLRETS